VILVDTSVWVDHLNAEDATLRQLLEHGLVLGHPFVTGELALGNLRNRDLILGALQQLPQAILAANAEVLELINRQRLFGLGIGYVDAHLLAAVRMTAEAALWTRDRRLRAAAGRTGVPMLYAQ
jgi:predicted nucleic acid-binding protein